MVKGRVGALSFFNVNLFKDPAHAFMHRSSLEELLDDPILADVPYVIASETVNTISALRH